MLTVNKLFGFLTGLVEEHRKTENFFQALKYKKNFFKINTLMEKVKSEFENVEIVECFDHESEDEHVSTFRQISFNNIYGLSEFLIELDEVLEVYQEEDNDIVTVIIK